MATPTTLPASFTTGAVLTAAEMNNLRGAFRILQISSTQGTTQTTSTSTTYATTNLSASITPSATSSQILILSASTLLASTSAAVIGIRFVRGATTIYTNPGAGYFGADLGASVFNAYLDSPSTTSATTYTVQFARVSGTGTAYAQLTNQPSTLILAEISA
jgi:hypothetical protein